MHWLDIGLTILGVAVGLICLCGAVLVVLFTFMLGSFILINCFQLFMEWLTRRFVETPFGTFATTEGGWAIWKHVGPTLIVQDRDGAPDPSFIEHVPTILAGVKELEGLARTAYNFEALECPYELDRLFQVEHSNDFDLVFIPDDEAELPCEIRVRFHDGRVSEVFSDDQFLGM